MRRVLVGIIIGMVLMAAWEAIPFHRGRQGPLSPIAEGNLIAPVLAEKGFARKSLESRGYRGPRSGPWDGGQLKKSAPAAGKPTPSAPTVQSVQVGAGEPLGKERKQRQLLGLFLLLQTAKASRGF